jgi:adenylylsulfate kinase
VQATFKMTLNATESHGADMSPSRTSQGVIVWLTGLSGAGKSTLAAALRDAIMPIRDVHVLDGDEIRTSLSKDLGYSREDRETNVRRIGFVARILAGHGIVVVVAAISPYASSRDEVQALAREEGLEFVEVFVHAPLDTLIGRHVKGLYRRALAGEVEHFTGISDPYEPPTAPAIVVYTATESVQESTARILRVLVDRGVAPKLEAIQ